MRTEAELKVSLDEMTKWYEREGMPTLDWDAVQFELAGMLRDKLRKEIQARYAELHVQEMHTLLGLVRERKRSVAPEAVVRKAHGGGDDVYVPEAKQGKGKRK